MARPIAGTLAEAHLRRRGIDRLHDVAALRFHPYCFYRLDEGGQPRVSEAWPALIAAVTEFEGVITGVQRTWLDPSGRGKAPVPTPRRAMGRLLGHAVRFCVPAEAGVMTAGEGIETVLSLRGVLPAMPLVAALSANHLAALLPPSGLRRLYIVRDNDRAGYWAVETLAARARAAGIEAIVLAPRLDDFNDDLRQLGPRALATGYVGSWPRRT